MPTLKQIKNESDVKLTNFWKVLQLRQKAFFAKHGKYFQLLVSPTTEVVNGRESKFSVRKPIDEKFAADVSMPWTVKVPFQVEVYEWTKGSKAGYSMNVTIKTRNGEVYRKIKENTGQTTDWFKVIDHVRR